MYFHETLYSGTLYDLGSWPQGKTYSLDSYPGHNICSMLVGTCIPFSANGYHIETMCHLHSWPLYDLDPWSQGKNYTCSFDSYMPLWSISFVLLHRYTIFSKWVDHNETMCCIHSWPLNEFDPWSQGQNYRFLTCIHIKAITSLFFDTGIPYLYHHVLLALMGWRDILF